MHAGQITPTPRLSATALAFPPRPVAQDIAAFAEAGVPSIGVAEWRLEEQGWDSELAVLKDSPVPVAYLLAPSFFTLEDPSRWPAERERLLRVASAARDVGANLVYGTTGPAGSLSFEAATEAFAEAAAPVVEAAADLGVTICFETTNQLRQELGFTYTFRDQVVVSEASGMPICLDLAWTWRERGLVELVAANADRIAMMQVSDYIPPSTSMPDRAVPGDGIVPLKALLAGIHAAGFRGLVDVELLGPRIDAEGAVPALRRGVARVAELLAARTAGV
ncbi:sugar phosphate isomerase/epimerase [Pseudonocardia sp. NPDC049154]|uniref:sugar phosphate isomerase/epimerase family protein n=1 Tax=Pseudonocardia sp. NPDC049154 TaxID=3155501 RepID=UPI0034014429